MFALTEVIHRLRFLSSGQVLRIALSILLFAVGIQSLRAQGTADLVGTVTDGSGGAIAGATVTAKNLGTNLTRTTATGSAGEYTFGLLPVGSYSVTVEARGFKTFALPNLTVASGERPRVNAQMGVGDVTQTVEVAGQTTALQTETAVVGALVTTQAVQDLPVNGRNFIKLVQLTPGANEGPQSSLSGGTRPDDRRQTSTVSANGQSAESNNYLLDGMDNNERSIATIIVKPSIDALQEVKVETNLYSAEFGRAGGAIINMITKSGTNTFHGTLFEFLRNDAVDAKSFFNTPQAGNPLAGKQTEFRQNQFGGSIGGPIRKDKTFFFGDYEGFRKVQGQTRVLTLPTACELGKATCHGVTQLGNFSDLPDPIYDPTTYNPHTNSTLPFANNIIPINKIDSIGANYAALFPALPAAACATTCQYIGSPTISQFAHTGDVRIDQRFSDKNMFYGRYSINNTETVTQSYLPPVKVAGVTVQPSGTGNTNFPGTADQRQQSIGLSHVHIFRPNLILQLNAQLARYVSDSEGPNAGVAVNNAFGGPVNGNTHFPGTDGLLQASFLDGDYTALGDAFALPTAYWDTNYLYGGAVSWNTGTHSLKFGVSYMKRDFSQYQIDTKGILSFSSTESDSTAGDGSGIGGNSLASLLLGYPENFDREEQPIAPQYRSYELGAFIEDSWRVNRWLTLNLGMRYDIFSPLSEKHNTISNFDPTIPSVLASGTMQIAGVNGVSETLNIKTQKNNFQPRIGFAASIGHGTVVRGGFGISYYPNNVASPANFKNQPWGIIYTPETALGAVPTLRLKDPLPPPTFLPACLTAACGPNFPFYVSASTQVDYHYTRLYQYNLTVEKEIAGNIISAGYVGQNGRHLGRVVPNMNAPLPPKGPGGCGTSSAISLPDPCQPYFSIMPQNNGLQLLETNGISNYSALQLIFQRRYSAGLTAAANYTFSHGLADVGGAGGPCATCATILNNFGRDYGNSDFMVKHRIAITANYALPFAKNAKGVRAIAAKDWQVNGIYSYATGLPFTVTNSKQQTNIGGGADRPNALPQGNFTQNLNEWFDTSAFRMQPFGTAGNEGRNQFFSPPSFRTDVSLFKDFPIRESVKLQFRVEAFNVTNSPSFAPPTVRASKWVGSGPAAVPSSVGNNFGKITATNAFYTPRDIQFALKLLF